MSDILGLPQVQGAEIRRFAELLQLTPQALYQKRHAMWPSTELGWRMVATFGYPLVMVGNVLHVSDPSLQHLTKTQALEKEVKRWKREQVALTLGRRCFNIAA